MRPNEKELYIQARIKLQEWLGKEKSKSDKFKYEIKAGMEYDALRMKGREDIINSEIFSREMMDKLSNAQTELDNKINANINRIDDFGKSILIAEHEKTVNKKRVNIFDLKPLIEPVKRGKILQDKIQEERPDENQDEINQIVSNGVLKLLYKIYWRMADRDDLLDELKLLKIKKEMVKSILSRNDINRNDINSNNNINRIDINSNEYKKQLDEIDKSIKIYENALGYLDEYGLDTSRLNIQNEAYFWQIFNDLAKKRKDKMQLDIVLDKSVTANGLRWRVYESLDLLKDDFNEKIDSLSNSPLKQLIKNLVELIEVKHELRYQKNRFKYNDSLVVGASNQILKVLNPGNIESLKDNEKNIIYFLNQYDNSNGVEMGKLNKKLESLTDQFNILKGEITKKSENAVTESFIDYVEWFKNFILELNDLKIEHYDLKKQKLFADHELELMQFQENKINDNLEAFLKNEGYDTCPIRYIMDDIFECYDFKDEYLQRPQTRLIRYKIAQLDNYIEQCKKDIQSIMDKIHAELNDNEDKQHTSIFKIIPEELSNPKLDSLEVQLRSIKRSYIEFKREDNINRDINKLYKLAYVKNRTIQQNLELFKEVTMINLFHYFINNSFETRQNDDEQIEEALQQIRILLKGAYLNKFKAVILWKSLGLLYEKISSGVWNNNLLLKKKYSESRLSLLLDTASKCENNAIDVIRYMFRKYPDRHDELIDKSVGNDLRFKQYLDKHGITKTYTQNARTNTNSPFITNNIINPNGVFMQSPMRFTGNYTYKTTPRFNPYQIRRPFNTVYLPNSNGLSNIGGFSQYIGSTYSSQNGVPNSVFMQSPMRFTGNNTYNNILTQQLNPYQIRYPFNTVYLPNSNVSNNMSGLNLSRGITNETNNRDDAFSNVMNNNQGPGAAGTSNNSENYMDGASTSAYNPDEQTYPSPKRRKY